MTMHLVGPYMTTTNYRKPKKKPMTKSQEAKMIESHKAYNKNMRQCGFHDMQLSFDEYVDYTRGVYKGKKKDTKETYKPSTGYQRETPQIPSLGDGIGNGLKKQTQQYTGTLIKGIATMHKSNAVPIISKEDAISVASMRRN